jgi:UDP-sulfoquinovose synthase
MVWGWTLAIKSIENPRKEAEDHYYNPAHTGLLDIGLKPHHLTDDVLSQMVETVLRYKENIKKEAIFRGVKWG